MSELTYEQFEVEREGNTLHVHIRLTCPTVAVHGLRIMIEGPDHRWRDALIEWNGEKSQMPEQALPFRRPGAVAEVAADLESDFSNPGIYRVHAVVDGQSDCTCDVRVDA